MQKRSVICFTLLTTLFSAHPTYAVIMALTPLKQPLESEEFIFVTKVKEVLPDKPALVLVVDENMKGKVPFDRLPVNLKGDAEAQKGKHTEVLLDRVEKDTPIVVFASKSKSGKKYTAWAFTNGTWFQMEGTIDADGIRWGFLHCEPYLRRTFKGTTQEMKQIVTSWVKDKKDPPKPNEKEEPGFGPAIKKPTSLAEAPIPLFGVIQLPFLGLIAALAALFPTVFGGLALFMRRWMVLLSMAGFISLIYFVFTQFSPQWVSWTGIDSMERMWESFAILAALGGIWAGSRYRRSLNDARAEDMQPRKSDRTVLLSLLGICLGALAYASFDRLSLRAEPWPMIMVVTLSIFVGSLYAIGYYLQIRHSGEPKPFIRLSVETTMLWALVLGFCCVSAYEIGRSAVKTAGAQQGSGDVQVRLTAEPKWVFEPKDNGKIFSVPCVTPDGIYISVYHAKGFSQYGRVYAVDPQTGQELWRFGDDEDMKAVFCAPVYHDGKIYIGEGFHKDSECRMFCLDARNQGKKLWEFQIHSHAESTPSVADGKVVFGAGNDGIYCLDAATGKEIWHYTGNSGIHVDASPAIWDGKVYIGSGSSNAHKVNQIACLDLTNGKELWAERVEMSCYGAARVFDGQVFYGLGNSTFSEQRNPIAGSVLCRDARTGQVIWDCALPNTVISQTAADRSFVYAGCYDGNCYAIYRKNSRAGRAGTIAWKAPIGGGPVVADIVAAGSAGARISEVIYAAGRQGVLAALDPHAGGILWNINMQALTDMPEVETDAAPAVVAEDNFPPFVRRIYVGVSLSRGETLSRARLYCFEEETGARIERPQNP